MTGATTSPTGTIASVDAAVASASPPPKRCEKYSVNSPSVVATIARSSPNVNQSGRSLRP
jgi:hypothetical protein